MHNTANAMGCFCIYKESIIEDNHKARDIAAESVDLVIDSADLLLVCSLSLLNILRRWIS